MNKYEATQLITNEKFWKDKPTLSEIQECIEAGADLTQLVQSGYNYSYPLAFYAAQYVPEVIPEMIKAGMDINQKCQDGTTIELASYCSRIKPKGMKYLLDNGANIYTQPINTSMGCSDPEGQAILNNIKEKCGFTLPSYTGVTCVGWALIEGVGMGDNPDDQLAEEQRQKVGMLFEAGIHPDAPAHDGEPPIFSTSINGHEKATQMILDHGGNIDAKSSKGDTALTHMGKIIARDYKMHWIKEGHVDMTEAEKNEALAQQYMKRLNLLISKGASLNLPDGEGKTFENGPASQIPFVAQLIKIYHTHGKDGVNQWIQKWYKIWEKERHDRWFSNYQKNKIQEAERRNEIAQKMKKSLGKHSVEGKQEALKIAKRFHVFQADDSHQEWVIKNKFYLRPTALKLGR